MGGRQKWLFFPFREHLKGPSLPSQSPSLCPGDSRQASLEIATFETELKHREAPQPTQTTQARVLGQSQDPLCSRHRSKACHQLFQQRGHNHFVALRFTRSNLQEKKSKMASVWIIILPVLLPGKGRGFCPGYIQGLCLKKSGSVCVGGGSHITMQAVNLTSINLKAAWTESSFQSRVPTMPDAANTF